MYSIHIYFFNLFKIFMNLLDCNNNKLSINIIIDEYTKKKLIL